MGSKLRELEEKRERVKKQLTGVGDMRQGTVSERYLKCGKAECRCGKEEAYAHGPYFSLTKAVKGKTVTRVIPKPLVELTRVQIAEFREFRRLSQEFLAVNEEICEAKRREPREGSERDQKKTSKRFSKPK